jgi:hypothetical protein
VDTDALLDAISHRDVKGVLQAMGVEQGEFPELEAKLSKSFKSQLNTIYFDAAIAVIAGIGIAKAIVSPLAHSAQVDQITANLISSLGNDSAAAIVKIVEKALQLPLPKQTIAALIRGSIGLTANQAESLRTFAGALAQAISQPGSANARGLSPLQARFLNASQRSILGKALRDGELDDDQIRDLITKQANQLKAHRAKSIATTEATRTANLAAQEAIQQAIAAGLVKAGDIRKYLFTAGDEKVRVDHTAAVEMNPLGRAVNEDFSSPFGPGSPPWEINCRCGVAYETAGDDSEG